MDDFEKLNNEFDNDEFEDALDYCDESHLNDCNDKNFENENGEEKTASGDNNKDDNNKDNPDIQPLKEESEEELLRKQRIINENNLSEEELTERLNKSKMKKENGNEKFRNTQWEAAKLEYSQAIDICPLKYKNEHAIFYSNRAACLAKLGENEKAINDCSSALLLDEKYVKALLRRANLYESTEKFDEALEDYKKLLEIDPGMHDARRACLQLPDKIKERNEKMKDEMIGKLKDLGNIFLKPFGLSTNNFQMNQDPNTGSYSVNFTQNR